MHDNSPCMWSLLNRFAVDNEMVDCWHTDLRTLQYYSKYYFTEASSTFTWKQTPNGRSAKPAAVTLLNSYGTAGNRTRYLAIGSAILRRSDAARYARNRWGRWHKTIYLVIIQPTAVVSGGHLWPTDATSWRRVCLSKRTVSSLSSSLSTMHGTSRCFQSPNPPPYAGRRLASLSDVVCRSPARPLVGLSVYQSLGCWQWACKI